MGVYSGNGVDAMIAGGRVTGVEAKLWKSEKVTGMDIAISIESVTSEKNRIAVGYAYKVNYAPEIGFIEVSGEIFLEDKESELKRIMEQWTRKKELPVEIAEQVLTAITYTGSTVGTLAAFALNINAPINVPRTKIAPAEAKEKQAS